MTEDHGQERRLIAVTRTDPPTRATHDVLGDDEDAPPARPDGPGGDFSPEDGGRDAQGLTEALEAAGDYADPADGITDDVIVLAARYGWPYVRCGQPCGFVATGPPGGGAYGMFENHRCGQPGDVPDIRGAVVGCITFIAALAIVAWMVLQLVGGR